MDVKIMFSNYAKREEEETIKICTSVREEIICHPYWGFSLVTKLFEAKFDDKKFDELSEVKNLS